MDDEIPPLSNEIIQFLRAIASPEDNHEFPLLHAAADDLVHLRAEREESDNNDGNGHEDEPDQHRNQGNQDDENEEDEEEHFRRRQRRDALRLRLRDRGLSAGRHDRILDWADLLLQIEDQSVTFGLQRLEFEDGYIGIPDDYVDETAYNSLLQTLAEGDNNERRGALPASRLAIEALQTVEANANTTELCAVCKDEVFNNNEDNTVKQLPCGHMYHDVCITPWLDSRNTCPVCRHELPTDDPEYEVRRQRSMDMASTIDHGARAL